MLEKDAIDVALLGDIPISPPVNAEGGVSVGRMMESERGWSTQTGTRPQGIALLHAAVYIEATKEGHPPSR